MKSSVRRLGLLTLPFLFILTACGQAAPSPGPTAAPAAPVAAPSPVAAAATAVASPVAAAVASASPMATALASPVATLVAAASPAAASVPVQISGLQLSPTDPTLTLRNTGSSPVDLTGWRLEVGSTMVSLPSSAQIGAGGSLTVHLTSGTSSSTDLYLGQAGSALIGSLQPGAKVALTNPQGGAVSEYTVPRL